MDSGEIDLAVLDLLKEIYKQRERFASFETLYATEEFVRIPIIRAVMDLNIMFKSKFHDSFYIEHRFYA